MYSDISRLIYFLRFRHLVALMLPFLLAGCGGKGSTKLSYQAPAALPLGISFTLDKDGSWILAAGIATPMGTFSIEHTFASRDEFTYIVLRNREKGTDQVFKIGITGYVDVHAIGEHRLRMQRDGNRWIIDTQTISGTLTIKVYPSNAAIARVDFGEYDPEFVVTTDRKLIIEYPSSWSSPQSIPLDSVQAITLIEGSVVLDQSLSITWKRDIHDDPIKINIVNKTDSDMNFASLSKSIGTITPHVSCNKNTYYSDLFILSILIIMSFFVGLVIGCDNVLSTLVIFYVAPWLFLIQLLVAIANLSIHTFFIFELLVIAFGIAGLAVSVSRSKNSVGTAITKAPPAEI